MIIDPQAAALSLLLLLAGLAALWLFTRLPVQPTATTAVFLATPLVAYFALSGAITELSGGGFTATFTQNVTEATQTGPEWTEDLIIGAEALDADQTLLTTFAIPQRIVVLRTDYARGLSTAEADAYRFTIARGIWQSLLSGGFEGMVVLDDGMRPIAVVDRSFFLELLRLPMDPIMFTGSGADLVPTLAEIRARLRTTNTWALLRNPRTRAPRDGDLAYLRDDEGVASALRYMTDNNFALAAITNRAGRFAGAVSAVHLRNHVLVELLAD